MYKYNLILQITILLNLFQQIQSICNYISTEAITISKPKQEIDVELKSEILNSQENIGYGLWVKYQPFIPISDVSSDSTEMTSSSSSSLQFIYLLQQKQTKQNMLTFYIQISDQTQTITHNVFYTFQKKIDTLVFEFEHEKYEGQWILFYFFFNLQSKYTTIGFKSLEKTITPKVQILNDIPELVQEIRHQIGGEQEISNFQGKNLHLTQFLGRISTVFSQGSVNIFEDLETFLLHCQIASECYESTYKLSSTNQAFLGEDYFFGTTIVLEYPIYVIKGWLKLLPFEKSPLDTVIFRVTINQDYQDDMKIGDKDIYLQYFQNNIPESNGFSITTYSYNFPIFNRYTSTTTDVISDFGAQYQELLIKWHYIQYEIGTNDNQEQPIFQMYFPSLIDKQKIFHWSNKIKHFTGTKMYYYIGGDKYSKNYLQGYISDMQFISYCTIPIISLSPECHYSCLTCNGPNYNNCLSCPSDSQRIQDVSQKICACKKKYLDIENEPICKLVSEVFPQIQEMELKLQCDFQGYDVCIEEWTQCSFGYFLYQKRYCLQCPGYLSFNTRNMIQCSNCLFYPDEFQNDLRCTHDTITYKYNEDFLYKTVKRTNRDIEKYSIIENIKGDYEVFLYLGFDDYCQEGYFLRDNNCNPCSKGCHTCHNELICQICDSGYALTKDYSCTQFLGCTDCSIELGKVLRMTCATGTYLSSNGSCISCGLNCQSCDSNGICQYCNDPSQYFKSFDGHNCQPCSIINCVYCYQYFVKNGITYTTLDIKQEILELTQEQFFIGCALCQANLYYNQVTLTCEQKPVKSSTINDCTFGLIVNSSGDTECLISTTSIASIQNADCFSIQKCQECIKKYRQAITFCIICEEGFYSSILTGQCLQCDSTCLKCVQQSQTYQDQWKWNIKAYYKYVFNQDDTHPFELYAVQNDFEVICTSCPFGYILDKHKCIKYCDSECNKCEIINGVATCIQCQETPYGFFKSLDSNGKCLTCPSYCAACLERDDDTITQFNPYFIPSTTNLKYTRLCYEKFDLDPFEGQFFYDQNLKTITFCEKYDKCYHQVTFVQNIYCSLGHFNEIADNLSGEALNTFKLKNIYISDLFEEGYLSAVEIQELFQYLNEKVIREVFFEYTLIQDQDGVCIISKQSQLFSKIRQNVFTVQTISIKFIGQSYPTTLIVQNRLIFTNFTTIAFQNISFFKNNYFYSKFIFEETENLKFQDCVFTQQTGMTRFYEFVFYDVFHSLYINNLTMENLTIIAFIRDQLFLIYFTQVEVYNLKIINSYFEKTTLFKFYGFCNFKNISITNTTFDFSSFIYFDYNRNLSIQDVILNAVSIKEKSSFINLRSNFHLQGLIILDSVISSQSYFQQCQNFELKDAYINNINISRSTLFSNDIQFSLDDQSKYYYYVSIINCTIENAHYNHQSTIIKLFFINPQYHQSISIKQFKLSKSVFTQKIPNNQLSYTQSIVYLQCQTCILEDVEIQRGHGLPELVILNSEIIFINRVKFTQSILFSSKPLHQSVDCMLNYAYENMYHYLYIAWYQNITINNLELFNSITYNNPFIIIEANNLREKIQNEYITIQNCTFESNMLIITQSNTVTSIIQLLSDQNCKITIYNVIFNNNHLHQYVQDLSRLSASTLLFQLQQGDVQISNTVFKQNLVTNSTDSILYIRSINVQFQKNQFYNNNILNLSILAKNLLFFEDQQYNDQISLIQVFPIKSKSGNGLIIANIILIDKTSVNNSYSIYGGGFYLVPKDKGIINISNSIFQNTLTSLSSSSFSTGGCLFIDAQSSLLHLQMYQTILENSFSRIQGGGIYIVPSQQQNYVNLQNLTISNCFSIQYGFFSYLLTSLQSLNSKVTFSGIQFIVTKAGFMKFLSILESPTKSDIDLIRNNNPFIKVKFGFVSINNCSFISTHIQFLIDIEFANNILIQDIFILNSTILYSPLIRLSLRQTSH